MKFKFPYPQIKFSGPVAMLSLYVTYGYSMLQGHSRVAATETILPAKSTLFATWPFIQKVC